MGITEAPGAGDAPPKCITEYAVLVAPLTHLVPVTHHTWVVSTPGPCAETKFPAGINLVQAMAPIWRQWFTGGFGLSLFTIPVVSALPPVDEKAILQKLNPTSVPSSFLGWDRCQKSPHKIGTLEDVEKKHFFSRTGEGEHFRVAKFGFWDHVSY